MHINTNGYDRIYDIEEQEITAEPSLENIIPKRVYGSVNAHCTLCIFVTRTLDKNLGHGLQSRGI
jgi:hypothetical protein